MDRSFLSVLKTLKIGHSIQLPRDNSAALNMLLPMVLQKEHRKVAELISSSPYFDINTVLPKIRRTLLHMAANIGTAECVSVLLSAGADPNQKDIHGVVPLHFAARNGFKDCCKLLLNKGADAKVPDNDGLTSVHWAALSGRNELLADLLSRNIELNVRDKMGQTALHFAAMHGHFKTVEYLVENGAQINDINTKGNSPLILACKEGHQQAIELLLLYGASPSSKNAEGMSVLQILISNKYLECVYSLTHSHPSQLCNLIETLKVPHLINYRNVINCIQHICTRKRSLVLRIWETLVSITINTGKEVMSSNSDKSTPEAFLSLVKALKHMSLLDEVSLIVSHCATRSPSLGAGEASNIATVSPPTTPIRSGSFSYACFHESPVIINRLDEVWSILEDWMLLLRDEIVMKRRSDISISELLATTDEDNRAGHLFLSDTFQGDNNSLDRVSGNLCTVIEAYHLWSKDTSLNGRFEQFVSSYSDVFKVFLAHNSAFIFNQLKFFLESPNFMKQFNGIRKVVYQKDLALRKKWFYDSLYGDITPNAEPESESAKITIRRDDIFNSSCQQIHNVEISDLRRNFVISFEGDQGIGAGVRREWFAILTNEMLNEDYALFTHSNDGMTFQPSHISDIQEDHLSYFRFAGVIMGLSLYHNNVINIHFTKSFYKHILGIPSDYTDVRSIDPGYANSLQWLLDNDISQFEEDLGLTFSEDQNVLGETRVVELKPGGAATSVTEKNKHEYVELITEYKMTSAIKPQITSFLDGFHSIIPASLVAIFNENELELLMCGIPEIDPADWEVNTSYSNYGSEDDVIKWFWEVVQEFTPEERALLLQFSTGSSKVPLGGFAGLQGSGEIMPFTISRTHDSAKLPTASTCFNLLKLPNYKSFETVKAKLKIAIKFGAEGFDFV